MEQERLVTTRANRRSYVWNPTQDDVDEILSLRVQLESLAAELVIQELTEQDYAELEGIANWIMQSIDAGDLLQRIHQDRRFHEYLCRRANHSRLFEWWQQIMSQWEVLLYHRLEHDPSGIPSSVPEGDHYAIPEALKAQDLKEVTRLHRLINQRVGMEMKTGLKG